MNSMNFASEGPAYELVSTRNAFSPLNSAGILIKRRWPKITPWGRGAEVFERYPLKVAFLLCKAKIIGLPMLPRTLRAFLKNRALYNFKGLEEFS